MNGTMVGYYSNSEESKSDVPNHTDSTHYALTLRQSARTGTRWFELTARYFGVQAVSFIDYETDTRESGVSGSWSRTRAGIVLRVERARERKWSKPKPARAVLVARLDGSDEARLRIRIRGAWPPAGIHLEVQPFSTECIYRKEGGVTPGRARTRKVRRGRRASAEGRRSG